VEVDDARRGEGDQRDEEKEKKEEGLKQKHVGERLRRTNVYFGERVFKDIENFKRFLK